MNGQVLNSQEINKGTGNQRNTSFNQEEIKVRWKKAALENCTGVPCVTTPAFTCGTSTIYDVDSNVYNTVLIDMQCWTKENLKVTKYNDGTLITLNNTYTSTSPDVSTVWQGYLTGAYSIYANESSTGPNATNYGYLYNWYAATDLRKLCPTGWHVPTDTEWTNLIQFIDPTASANAEGTYQSTSAGGKLKSIGTTFWISPNTDADNFRGFSALPGGFRLYDASFNGIGSSAYFWSATEYNSNNGWLRGLANVNGWVNRYVYTKSTGSSIRCLRD